MALWNQLRQQASSMQLQQKRTEYKANKWRLVARCLRTPA